ncbi:unnamed protein product [Brassicogethes aeneus]|uniref:Uncharacterized protein n=1 Tax=Brassicogethes aeneus TaxID=1431903 RepID=A0A9P0FJG3_BRAAE|nr:unnamed protein product [Brassicogethes aeneus]
MYKISYEKCVCFIFLVILAVLSCSGFRIDNLAMTDISKRNSPARFFLDSSRIYQSVSTDRTQSAPTYHHRIRHQRHLRAQAHTLRHTPTAQIDAITYPPRPYPPSPAIVTRPQRSSQQQHHPNKRNLKRRPGDDVTKKTYEAPIVVLAKAESRQINGSTYTFRLIETIKNNSTMPVDDALVITFHKTTHNERKKHREQIKTSKEYILFLKYNGAHIYTVFSDPELLKKNVKSKTLKVVRKIANPNFRPKPVEVTLERKIPLKEVQSTQLICKTRGLPIPNITWRRNGNDLHRSQKSIQIIYNKKRKSTLIVKNSTNHSNDIFECIATGVDGAEEKAFFSVSASASSYDEKDCTSTGYCLNGKCTYISSMREPYCLCFDGFFGDKCQNFKPPGSMYTPPSQFACKLGLQTKFNC